MYLLLLNLVAMHCSFFSKLVIVCVLISVTLLGCNGQKKTDADALGQSGKIVLADLSTLNRARLAEFIDSISVHGPRVIGINAIFDSLSDGRGDSLLALSIMNSGRVVLVSGVENSSGKYHRSNSIFRMGAKGEGVQSNLVNDRNLALEYVPLYENSEGQQMNFATGIALWFTEDDRIWDGLRVNKIESLDFETYFQDFTEIAYKDADLQGIDDKIVLIGDLSGNTDLINVKVDGKIIQSNYTELYANIIERLVR